MIKLRKFPCIFTDQLIVHTLLLLFFLTQQSIRRAGNWWKITNSNRTTVHYGGPPQTVVINCNPQIHQTHEITGINQTERLTGQ